MTNRLSIFLGGFLVAILIAACIVAVLKIDLTPPAERSRPVERTRNFGEGLKLSKSGLYGIDLVSIGKAHMRKLRKGPFTIGAINELVLEEVELALPEELWNADAARGDAAARRVKKDGDPLSPTRQAAASPDRGTAAKRMLSKLGLNASNLKMGGKVPRFSALVIRNLKIARIVDGTNAVPWFAASNAKAEREGLALYSGWSVEGGVTNSWKEAFLAVEPALRLYHP